MRRVVLAVCSLALIAGCEDQKAHMAEMGQAKPGPELAKLNRMVGTWTGTAEIVKPTREEMMKHMPKGMPMPAEKMQGGGTWSWMPGGMVLKCEGWHEMSPGMRVNMVEFIGWNPREREYWMGFVGDNGEHGVGEMKIDGNTMSSEGKSCDAQGNSSHGKGTMTWVDDNTMNWTWTEWGPMGEMQMKGTSRKVGATAPAQSMQPMNQMAPAAAPAGNAPQEVQVSPG